MLFWKSSTNCCGTMSRSHLTLSRRWWNYRVSRCQPTSPPDTASCFTCLMIRPCWRSVLACWRKVFASWTHILRSLVREHCSQSKIGGTCFSDPGVLTLYRQAAFGDGGAALSAPPGSGPAEGGDVHGPPQGKPGFNASFSIGTTSSRGQSPN